MGKSTSCFKLFTCGGDVADKDDYQASEIKDSYDKRGWSFRKRSPRHRVLSNTVIAETPSSENKESSAFASVNFQSPENSNIVEKICTTHSSDDKPDKVKLSSLADSQISEPVVFTETDSKADVKPPESVVIIVQSAIRGFLAQRDLVKLKNVVKLQAAVRGHLVRRDALGTLRCGQAIVKMQLLVRARHAQKLEKHLNQKQSKNDGLKTLGNENHITKSNVTFTSIEKLLSNSFARQLLESTPRNKPIHVKCDPSKADSAWTWLERWMSVSSTDTGKLEKESSMAERLDDSIDSSSVSQLESAVQSEDFSESVDPKPTGGDSVLPSEDKEKLMTYDADNFSFQAIHCASSIGKDNLEQALPEETITSGVEAEIDPHQTTELPSDARAPKDLDSLPEKHEIDSDQPKRSIKRFASDQLETEAKKFVHGSRKAINPAFIAAQSKFEELSSITNSGGSSSLSYQDETVESRANSSSVGAAIELRTKEFFSSENSARFTSSSRFGGSECGTELSISSTLDSPDISEVGAIENEREGKDIEGICESDRTLKSDAKINITSDIPDLTVPDPVLGHAETVGDINGKMAHSVVDLDCKESAIQSEKNTPGLQREQAEAVVQDFRLSPEASPRSHITVPESQGTPSSQVSVKPKESKTDKTGSSNRRRSQSAGNKLPANANRDSGSRGSREQLPKDQSNAKRRNSFGSVKPDHIEQDPRDNSCNNDSSLPHFMQATESARAKLNANTSPRSSPDVHDRDVQVKKRHSLPGATNRQVSPRITRSTAQAQQGVKGNGVHHPHERKWQR